MKKFVIATGTLTQAIKGRDLLKKHGYAAEIERMKHGSENYGCGYAIVTGPSINEIEMLLREKNIRILKILPL